jgi:mevalonate kinase
MKKFPAKVLLFGEYAVLEGSEALASPLNDFYGEWSKDPDPDAIPEVDVDALIEHIEKLIDNKILTFDIEQMQEDWDDGWRLSSNIPVGYGLGSSGAFTAALYYKYGVGDFKTMAPNKVKRHSALIESFFHGESSGLDPTISIYNKAIHNKYEWEFVDGNIFDPIKDEGLRFFLLDSEQSRSSRSMIAHFKTQTTSPKFRAEVLQPLIEKNQKAIEYTLEGSRKLWDEFQAISQLEFSHFEPMIIDGIKEIWAEMLVEDAPHLLKLCGAGGGGYYLGLTKDIDHSMRYLGIDKVIML